MSDWPRYPIPRVPAWNNPADTSPFSVAYDAENDRLVVTSSTPIFVDGEFDYAAGLVDGGNLTFNGWTVNSPTEIELTTFFSTFIGGTSDVTLQQLDLYAIGDVLLGIWTGSVTITAPAGVPGVFDYSYPSSYQDNGTASGPPNCGNIATAALAVPGIFIYAENLEPDGGFIVTDTTPSSLVYTQASPELVSYDTGFAIIADANLVGRNIATIQATDGAGNPIGGATPFTSMEFLEVSSVDAGTPGELAINYGSLADNLPNYLDIYICPSAVRRYYDPAGPNAGLNPGTSTITRWDNTGVTVQDTAFDGTLDVIRLMLEGDSGEMYDDWGDGLLTL